MSRRSNGTTPERGARHLQACLAITCGYLLVISLGIAVRIEAGRFGITLSQEAVNSLRSALWLHISGAAIAALLCVWVRLMRVSHPLAGRVALAMMPLILLASIDRIVATGFERIRESTGLFIPHATRGWTSRPGWRGRDESAAIAINSLGLRGGEIPRRESADERRILFLGDSVAFGSRVEEEDCFVARIRERLRRRDTGRSFTVINASVHAYSPWQELDLLETEGMACDPDFVVHVFCLNDVLERFQLEKFGGYTRGFEPPLPSVLEWSGLYRGTRALKAYLRKPDNEELWRLRWACSVRRLLKEPNVPEVKRGRRITLESMDGIVSVARGASIPIVIVSAPHLYQFINPPPASSLPQTVLGRFAAERGVPFLDLEPVLRSYIQENDVDPSALFVDPVHMTSAGHEPVADAIFDFLSHQSWFE